MESTLSKRALGSFRVGCTENLSVFALFLLVSILRSRYHTHADRHSGQVYPSTVPGVGSSR